MTFLAGEILTASALNSSLPRIVRKTSDETVNNSATFQDDNELFLSVEASTSYRVHLQLVYQSNATPDFKYQFTAPSGATFPVWTFLGKGGGVLVHDIAGSSGGVVGLDGNAANTAFEAWGILVVSSTAGTLRVQWAQNTANASDTIVRAGSFLELVRAG